MPVLPTEVSPVSSIPSAGSAHAIEHFSRLLSLETDCWDVHTAMQNKSNDFVLSTFAVHMPTRLGTSPVR